MPFRGLPAGRAPVESDLSKLRPRRKACQASDVSPALACGFESNDLRDPRALTAHGAGTSMPPVPRPRRGVSQARGFCGGRMASQRLVRCDVRPGGPTAEPQVRFVPLEIFGLWEYLMTSRHGFE